MGRRQIALAGERAAEAALTRRGYRILERNFRTDGGEIDLVASDGDTLCFVEVKARSSEEFGSPEEAVTPQKRSRLRRAARAYLARMGREPDSCRFDVVAVRMDADGSPAELRILKDAFA